MWEPNAWADVNIFQTILDPKSKNSLAEQGDVVGIRLKLPGSLGAMGKIGADIRGEAL